MVPIMYVEVWDFVVHRLFAIPKSVRCASNSLPSRMFDDFTSLWMIRGLQSWWRYESPSAAPRSYVPSHPSMRISIVIINNHTRHQHDNTTKGDINEPLRTTIAIARWASKCFEQNSSEHKWRESHKAFCLIVPGFKALGHRYRSLGESIPVD